jgi:hypothetical protein
LRRIHACAVHLENYLVVHQDTQIYKLQMIIQCRSASYLPSLLLLFKLILITDAKTFGKDVFACSPTSFTFGLNFDGNCPGNINQTRSGIVSTDCYFVPRSNDALSPIIVRSIQIIESTLDFGNLHEETITRDFKDGEQLEYTSVTSKKLNDENDVPGGIQLNIRGVDSNGTAVSNTVILFYSNSPDAFPIQIGDEIGWINIVR